MAAQLTKNAIEALVSEAKATKSQRELIDEREPGLRFRAGERSAGWSLLVRLNNAQRTRIKLGDWPAMGVADARAAAREKRLNVYQGSNPNEEKRVSTRQAALDARNRTSLAQLLDVYETSVLSQHRRGSATRRALDGSKGLLSTLRNRKPDTITKLEIGDLLRKHARTAPISANRKLAYASAFFNWCVDEGILEQNPVERLRKPAKENERDRYHSLDELREIWTATGTLGYPFQQLYRLLIALPMRREELAAMPVADLTLSDDASPGDSIWILPADRTKKANPLRVPLSSLARSILIEAMEHEDRAKDSKFVFTTTGETSVSGFTKAKKRLDKEIHENRLKLAEREGRDPNTVEAMPHWTIHDLRTTFNTHACEVLAVPPHVADRILNHVATATRSKIMRVYNKSELFEPRKKVLGDWADLLAARVMIDQRSSV